jgi:arylsulfatase
MFNLKKSEIIKIILITTTISFYVGLIVTFEDLKLALSHVSANEYLSYKMVRLAALALKIPLLDWLAPILLSNLIVIAGYILWKLFFAKIFKIGLNFKFKNPNILKNYAAYVLTFAFLIYSEWTVNGKWASIQFSILNVALNIGILLLTCFVGWLLLKKKWEKLFEFVKFKYLQWVTIPAVILLFIFTLIVFLSAHNWRKPTGPNIVLIVVDCLRADHLKSYGYSKETSPNIDNIAATGILYKNAYSCAAWTKPAVASIFTSLYPNKHNTIMDVGAFPDQLLTLAEILKNNGYNTGFFNGGNPAIGGKLNFYQGFDAFFEPALWGTILTDQFLTHISGLGEEKFFAYIHYMDLHLPYNRNEYNDYFSEKTANYLLMPHYINRKPIRLATANDAFPEKDRQYLISLYDGQIRYIDNTIKTLIAKLKEKKLLKNTVVIITADHGEELWDHQNFEHGHTLYNELLHVPLIIIGGKFKSSVMETPVSIVDLFPTILDLANIPSGRFELDGKSLLKLHSRPIFAMGTLYKDEKYCLINKNLKLIFNSGGTSSKRPLVGYSSEEKFELFNLKNDPTEQHNLSSGMQQEMHRLRKELLNFLNVPAVVQSKKISIKDDKVLQEKLKSLGYL